MMLLRLCGEGSGGLRPIRNGRNCSPPVHILPQIHPLTLPAKPQEIPLSLNMPATAMALQWNLRKDIIGQVIQTLIISQKHIQSLLQATSLLVCIQLPTDIQACHYARYVPSRYARSVPNETGPYLLINVKSNSRPPSGGICAEIWPPWNCTAFLTTERPRPLPTSSL